jgi:parvulin-like peptidyl-prolyl isomerase
LPALIFLFSFTAFACRKKEYPAGDPSAYKWNDPQKQNSIILEIEGTVFVNADLERYLHNNIGENIKTLTAPALSRLFDDFAEEKLLLKKAKDQNLSLTEEEKKTFLSKRKSALWTGDGRESPIEENADDLYERLLVEKYLYLLIKKISVDPNEIGAYYSEHKNEFLQPDRVQVSQILLASEGKASQVLDKLKNASEEQFRSTAKAESVGPEASKGGIMGVFSAGQLPEELEKVVFSLKQGEISRIVESSYGFHIFRLDKKFEPHLVTVEEAAASIRAKRLEQKSKQAIAAHLEELKKTMDWKVYTDNLVFPYQRIES